jgi:CRISPR-associated protein Cmr6
MFRLPPDSQTHPGLLLDKWHDPWPVPPQPPPRGASKDEKEQYRTAKREFDEFARSQLERVTKASRDQALLDRLRQRFQRAMSAVPCRRWKRRTSESLALHLSRAGSFENAGICLHPIYGFAHLPGTGLKGMARSYARNVVRAPDADMEAVFGKDTTKEESGAAGGVIFFDALPVQWPKLTIDIVNNHHRQYYEGDGAPEDWEDPVPVNFLSVAPDTEFEFGVASRHKSDDSGRLLELAQAWIDGALAWLGAGAKTNAGYGRFSTGAALEAGSNRRVFTATVTFVSPAFLAGALQGKDDCALRPATLRGLLRSWWRTLHAGFLPLARLRDLEGELWGTTVTDGAISLHVEPASAAQPKQFNFSKPKDTDSVPGRFYLAYGMEGNPRQQKTARWYVEPGAKWKLTIVARPAATWSSETVLDQGVLALWLLSEYGGIGARCRRGFGSFELSEASLPLPTAKDVLTRAASVRPGSQYSASMAESPPLNYMVFGVLPLKSREVWSAIDQLGAAYRSFTSSEKRKSEKLALGLPRNIGRRSVDQRAIGHPAGRSYSRHASPMHFRLLRNSEGYSVRVTALPSPHLPDLKGSRQYLERCMDYMYAQLH